MSTDPMAGYDQAEAEAEARTDEARREQHWREAEQAARDAVRLSYTTRGSTDLLAAMGILIAVKDPEHFDGHIVRTLQGFNADYGTPALLRVIADALEAIRASR